MPSVAPVIKNILLFITKIYVKNESAKIQGMNLAKLYKTGKVVYKTKIFLCVYEKLLPLQKIK